MKFRQTHSVTAAASKAAISVATAYRIEQDPRLPRRERRSTQRLFEKLRGRGYDGAHVPLRT